jgi:predicted Zn finger-like uncharacterized protein
MATIRVTCPACKSELEIDAEFVGQEVECGNCLQTFTAVAKPAGESGRGTSGGGSSRGRSRRDDEDDRPVRSSRRDDDYDRDRDRTRDDDDDDFAPPPPRNRDQNTLAIASLILGVASVGAVLASILIGVCCCCFGWLPLPLTFACSIGAIVTGALALKKPQNKPLAIIGIVLGVLCLGLGILQLIFGFAPFVLAPLAPPQPPQPGPGPQRIR